MKKYKNTSGIAGIAAYEISNDAITIRFSEGGTYIYNYEKPGRVPVEIMKGLATRGIGLTTFINQHVRENYARKV